MPNPATPDVLVIGAGPVGLTAACELLRHGVNVRVVERRAQPVSHSHALVVHVRTQEVLDAMGAIGGFLAQGYRLPGIILRINGKRIGRIDPTGADSPYPGPMTISQEYTERILGAHLESLGGRVERQIEAVDISQNEGDEGLNVCLRHIASGESGREENVQPRWVIGCEGTDSLTRRTANISFEGERYSGEEFLMADARVRWSHPHGFGYMFYTEERVLGFFPFDDQGFYRVLCIRRDPDPTNDQPPTLEEMQGFVRAVADPAATLSDPAWLTRFRTGYRVAERFRDGRKFLAGDSGHAHSPIGGQGMNYGMQDAFNLAWKLAAVIKGEAPPELLDSYEKERHPVDEALVKMTDRAFHAITEPHPWGAAAFKLLGPTVLKLPMFQNRVRDTIGELKVAYKESALTEDCGGGNGPAAGERAPDALVAKVGAESSGNARIFDVLRGVHWTLFIFAGEGTHRAEDIEPLAALARELAGRCGARLSAHLVLTECPPPNGDGGFGVLMDTERFAHAKYSVGSAAVLYLVRPDWYIGFRGKLGDVDKLRAYLGRVMGAS